MKTSDVIDGFRCVEFKRQAQERIYEQIKDLTPQEEIEYFRRAAELSPLGRSWASLRSGATDRP